MDQGWCRIPSRTSHVRLSPSPVVLEVLHDAQRLLRMAERPAEERGERLLAEVPERCVAEIVPERDGLGQVLVQPQCARDRARD